MPVYVCLLGLYFVVMRKGCRAVKKKKNGTAIEGRGDRRVGLKTRVGGKNAPPAALTFDLCRM